MNIEDYGEWTIFYTVSYGYIRVKDSRPTGFYIIDGVREFCSVAYKIKHAHVLGVHPSYSESQYFRQWPIKNAVRDI